MTDRMQMPSEGSQRPRELRSANDILIAVNALINEADIRHTKTNDYIAFLHTIDAMAVVAERWGIGPHEFAGIVDMAKTKLMLGVLSPTPSPLVLPPTRPPVRRA